MAVRKMYLQLFHGRKSPSEELDDWGSDGPVFGPIEWFHVTYLSSFRFSYENEETGDTSGEFKFVEKVLLYYDGVYYGDWSLFMASKKDLKCKPAFDLQSYGERLERFNEAKATLP